MGSMSEHISEHSGWTEGVGNKARHPRGQSALGSEGRRLLMSAVKQSVIPRLVALPWVARAVVPTGPTPTIDGDMVGKLLSLCFETDGQGVAAYVVQLHRSGIPAESLYQDLLTPVVRQLGVMWENDDCSFADVTIGVLRLQNAQRALAPEFVGDRVPGLGAPRALLLPVPGDQHTFGLSIVLDYFLRAGWNAKLGAPGTAAEAVAQVRRERIELVGLSFACDDHLASATTLIRSLRAASANPDVSIMVGGPPFLADPALAAQIGADATALDGQQAVTRANELLYPVAGTA